MAVKFASFFILLFFISTLSLHPASAENPVTNQEIRDAILSLIHSYSLLDNKLDRHETRERSLGEVIKKGLTTLQKNQRIFEPIKGLNERMENRLSQIETFLIDQNDRSVGQQLKLVQTLEEIMKIIETSSGDKDWMSKKWDEINENIVGMKKDILNDQNVKEANNKKLMEHAEKLVASQQNDFEKVFNKINEKLSQMYITEPPKNTEFEEKISSTIQAVKTNIDQLKELYVENSNVQSSTTGGLSDSDRKFIEEVNNSTNKHLEEVKTDIISASDKNFVKASKENKLLQDSVEESVKTASMISADTQKIILDTSNNVLETKRRFEYGIHQIVLEVSEALKLKSSELNTTIYGLSSKIETEMSQIWRQIGIMYQEISSSKQALDRLQEQTLSYVNGSLTTMDSMEGKVSLITGRMQEVDSNLNYLLGRLSLVTQEFNQIKYGLGEALDNIKQSFITVQEKVKDVGPGPHTIDQDDSLNSISKRNAKFMLNMAPKNKKN